MKKLLLVFTAVLFLTPAIMNAQKISAGPLLGLNYNLYNFSGATNNPSGIGLAIGGQFDFEFSNSMGLIANIIYDSKYGNSSNSSSGYTYDDNIEFSYLTIEALLKFKLSSGFYFFAGPTGGFVIGDKIKETVSHNGSSSTNEGSVQNTQFQFDLKAGAGYDIPLSKGMTLSPFVGFSYGLTKLVKDIDWKLSSIQAGCVLKVNIN